MPSMQTSSLTCQTHLEVFKGHQFRVQRCVDAPNGLFLCWDQTDGATIRAVQ